MLKHTPPSEQEVLERGPFGDPTLRGKVLHQLGVAMWKPGMCVAVARKLIKFGVRICTVHKKTKQTDGGLVGLQRLIFYLRRVNMFFSTPRQLVSVSCRRPLRSSRRRPRDCRDRW